MPPKIFEGMYKHILTDKGLEIFDADYQATISRSKAFPIPEINNGKHGKDLDAF